MSSILNELLSMRVLVPLQNTNKGAYEISNDYQFSPQTQSEDFYSGLDHVYLRLATFQNYI